MSEEQVQAEGEDLVVRELLTEELQALATVPPFDQVAGLAEGSIRDHVRVIGAIRGGRLVAYWMAFDALHVEPLWIAEEERKNPRVGRALWEEIRKVVEQSGAPMAFAIMGDGALETTIPMLVRLGFQPLQGNLFYVSTAEMRKMRRGSGGSDGG